MTEEPEMTDEPRQPEIRSRPLRPPGEESDFALLSGDGAYARYFRLLHRSLELLLAGYGLNGDAASYEAGAVEGYLKRLLFTVQALSMKYTFSAEHTRMLWVDVSDSGFPNAQEISLQGVDLLNREGRLRELPAAALLKQYILDHMFTQLEEPQDMLWQLAQRSYLGLLDRQKLFLPFVTDLENEGAQHHRGRDYVRTYRTSWACYDYRSNRPYLHVMTFEQDLEQEPLDQRGPAHLRLLEVLEAEGSRAPDVGILAMAIDDALEHIHPKILKRIGLGPLYTPLLLEEEELEPDEKNVFLKEFFRRHGAPDDFILAVSDEIVFSRRQRVTRSVFAPGGRVREVFHLPDTDPESYRRRASVVHKHVLMPHALAQHLDREAEEKVPELRGARLLTYDAQGAVHAS